MGAGWFEKYGEEIKKGYITVNGKKYKTPKYYDSLLEEIDPQELQKLKNRRRVEALKKGVDEDRLEAMEKVKLAQNKILKRGYEE